MLHVAFSAADAAEQGPTEELSGKLAEAELAGQLRSISASIHEACVPIEDEFVQIGRPLRHAVQSLMQLSSTFEQLTLDLGQANVQIVSGDLERISEQAKAAADGLISEQQLLVRLIAVVRQMRNQVDEMRKSVNTIGIISTFVKIAATEVTSDESSFHEFTEELGRLRAAASTAVECFADECDRLASLLTVASHRRHYAEVEEGGALTSLRTGLAESLQMVSRQRAQAVAIASQIEDRSREIRKGVEAAIASLQVGDMLRQRVEHVEHALVIVAQAAGPAHDGPLCALGEPPPDENTVTSLVCRLQARQLEEAAKALETDGRQAISSLTVLAGEAAEIQRLGSALYSDTAGEGASFLTTIEDDLQKMALLLKSCEAARAEVDRAIGAALTILATLNGQFESIRKIEFEVGIAALNTAVRSARLGMAGKPLAVLAHELRMHGNLIVMCAKSIMSGLKEITAAADHLARSRAEGGQATLRSLEAAITDLTSTLGEAGDHVDRHLASLEEDAALAAREIEGAIASAISLDRIQTVLQTTAVDLLAVAQERPVDQACLPDACRVLHSILFGLYTMESERAAHAEVLGMPADYAADHKTGLNDLQGDEEASIDDLLF